MILKRMNRTVENAKRLSLKELESLRYLMMLIIVGDLFGIYWYFGLKKLGGAILIVSIVILATILMLERRNKEKMTEEKTKTEEKEDKEDKPSEDPLKVDLGLPSPEEFEKRMEDAIGI